MTTPNYEFKSMVQISVVNQLIGNTLNKKELRPTKNTATFKIIGVMARETIF